MLVTITCDIPNKRGYFSLSFDRTVIVFKFDLIFFSNFKPAFFYCIFRTWISHLIDGDEIFNKGSKISICRDQCLSFFYIGFSFDLIF